ncbi:MAG: hypothetical protein K0S81_2709 [Rhodospirillales bacterium]|jgi:hypothetical protein|nr:hypothetical protein [Rhodospirillales bacterium]
MLRVLAALAILLTAGSASATTTKPFETGGNWYGEAHFDESDGHFVFCAITADYQSGIRLGMFMAPDFQLGVSMQNPSWNMQTGSTFDVDLNVDRRWSRRIQAKVVDPATVFVFIGDDPVGVEALRRGYGLTVQSGDQTYGFDLVGSNRALAQASRCVLAHAGGGANPFTAGTEGSSQTAADQVAGLLLASGVENAVMMTPEQARDTWGEGHVGWYIQNGVGAMFTDETNGRSPDAFMNDFIAKTGSSCGGEYSSSFKPAPVPGMRRFFSTCRRGEVVAHVFGIIVFFDDGDAMSVIHFSDDASLAAVSAADERIVNGLVAWGAQ